MARELKAAKSETLTIRLDPKTRFVLEFLSRARGQTITMVVERAIAEAASAVSLDDGSIRWQDIWDVSEGVRAIRMARLEDLYPTFEEEQLLAFTRAHHEFFYVDKSEKIFRRATIDILWPQIRYLVDYWNNNRSSDYFGAGKKMVDLILAAGVEPPNWPKAKGGGRMGDDNDIPF